VPRSSPKTGGDNTEQSNSGEHLLRNIPQRSIKTVEGFKRKIQKRLGAGIISFYIP
jgi:hypothetical protein